MLPASFTSVIHCMWLGGFYAISGSQGSACKEHRMVSTEVMKHVSQQWHPHVWLDILGRTEPIGQDPWSTSRKKNSFLDGSKGFRLPGKWNYNVFDVYSRTSGTHEITSLLIAVSAGGAGAAKGEPLWCPKASSATKAASTSTFFAPRTQPTGSTQRLLGHTALDGIDFRWLGGSHGLQGMNTIIDNTCFLRICSFVLHIGYKGKMQTWIKPLCCEWVKQAFTHCISSLGDR